jgi:hypothetical protein
MGTLRNLLRLSKYRLFMLVILTSRFHLPLDGRCLSRKTCKHFAWQTSHYNAMLLCNSVRKEVMKYLVEIFPAMCVEELPMTRQTYGDFYEVIYE